jgi:ADP-ribosylglycohydrolase
MVSDDTEHACMTAQALLAHPDDAQACARSLAWRLRFWLLGLPAGVGLGTGRAICKLWIGVPPGASGVRSAGNGPAMRAPVIGAVFSGDRARLEAHVRACTRLTHRDRRAEQGALAVALCAGQAVRTARGEVDAETVLGDLRRHLADAELLALVDGIANHLAAGSTLKAYAESIGLGDGIGGFIYDTVPVALYAWLHSGGDFRRAVEEVILLGGDTDTTGAIVGGLAGATVGASGIPEEWLRGIAEWPRSVSWMQKLGERLARQYPVHPTGSRIGAAPLFWPGIPLRNLLFLGVVLAHGLRRLLPPY